MHLTTVILGCFLLGQSAEPGRLPAIGQGQPGGALQPIAQPEPEAAVGRSASETPPATEGSPAQPERNWLTPPEMAVEALAPRPASKLSGRPLTLLAALSAAADRQGQLAVTRAYWRLAEAVAVYHFAWEYDGLLRRLATEAGDAALLRTARASASALLGEAEVAAVAAQHELAALASLPPDAHLPLPVDCPHVGPYQTRIAELFPLGAAPVRTRLIDRTLPIRCQAIEGRASAVRAAEEAFSETINTYGPDRADLAAILACAEECLRQRRAFIADICRYNDDIAEYALAVAGPGILGKDLVRMLIRPTTTQDTTAQDPTVQNSVEPLAPRADTAVEPAGLNEPVTVPVQQPIRNQPTLAPPRVGSPDLAPQAPALVPPLESVPDSDAKAPASVPQWAPSKPPADDETPSALPPEGPTIRRVDKPAIDSQSPPATIPLLPAEEDRSKARAALSAAALYPTLVEATPGSRAKRLAETLHSDLTLPQRIGEPVGLEECLKGRSAGDRRGLIEAYWLVCQRAAEYQVLARQADWLEGLAPQDQGQPSAPRVRSARLAAEAALHEAHVELIEAQFTLASRMGRTSDRIWPMAGTIPHSGRYLLKLDTQPRRLAESWPLRRLAAVIPGLAQSVQQHATAVVEADAIRAGAVADYRDDGQSIEPALECIVRQTTQTRAFLQALTDYNRAIAEYALTVLPPEIPSETLVRTLVVVPAAE